jgi:hypothetical protein
MSAAFALAMADNADAQRWRPAAGVDLTVRSRGQWRGLDRSAGPVVHPSAFIAIEADRWEVATGGWLHVEPRRARMGRPTLVSVGESGIGEADLWAQATARAGRYGSVTIGATSYRYAAAARGGDDPVAFDTRELYLRLEARPILRLEQELTVWRDVGPARGTFAEATVRRALPLLPTLLPPTIVLAATAGWSDDLRSTGDERGYFERDGFRYLDLSLRTVQVVSVLGVAIGGAVHHQRVRGDARVTGSGPPLRSPWWVEIDLSAPATSARDRR